MDAVSLSRIAGRTAHTPLWNLPRRALNGVEVKHTTATRAQHSLDAQAPLSRGLRKRHIVEKPMHVLKTRNDELQRKVQGQSSAFRSKTSEKVGARKSETRALGCPCCGRRAALLGGTAGLLLPAKGQAASQALAPAGPVQGGGGPLRHWYEEFFAYAQAKTGDSYEPKIRPYKDALFGQVLSSLKESRPADATLEVVDVGVGAAPNLHYWAAWPGSVHITGVDRNASMQPYAQENAQQPGLERLAFNFTLGTSAALPMASESADVVVGTLILCSVDDVTRSLAEIKRVLRPGGKYLFVEHVAAPDGTLLRRVQDVLNPLQQALADGCNLNRNTLQALQSTGFSSVEASNISLDGLGPLAPQIVGIATA